MVDCAMKIGKKRFQKMFPHLFKELECKTNRTIVSSAKSQNSNRRKCFDNYEPTVIDFIRRCDNEKQAEEVIDFLEKSKDLTHKCATQLRKELGEKGVRSFGKKKINDYYLKPNTESES